MTIVLLEHRMDYRAIYGMNLSLYLGAKVLVANTIKQACDFIASEEVNLLFVNNDAYTQDIGRELWLIFQKKQYNVPLYVLGNSKVPQEEVTLFDKNIQLRDVLKSIASDFNITAKKMVSIEFPKDFPLPTDFIIPGWQASVEIGIKVGGKYQSYFEKDEIITAEKLDQVLESNNDQLYVDRDERLKFVNSLTTQISAKLNDPNLSPEERISTVATGYQMVMEQSRKIGIAESTLDLANDCIDSMQIVVDQIPTLEGLLKSLMKSQASLRYKQSLLINYIGCHIIKKTQWGNKEQQEKFSFVSFFHNITLTKDEHVKIMSDRQLDASNLPDNEKELVRNHALDAAKLVSSIDKIPFGASTIIKQHHGSSKGIGLSKLHKNISPLAIVFIFAQEWANLVLQFEDLERRPKKKEIIEMLHDKYNQSGFHKILPILHTLEF